jgi:hypothetical protein
MEKQLIPYLRGKCPKERTEHLKIYESTKPSYPTRSFPKDSGDNPRRPKLGQFEI